MSIIDDQKLEKRKKKSKKVKELKTAAESVEEDIAVDLPNSLPPDDTNAESEPKVERKKKHKRKRDTELREGDVPVDEQLKPEVTNDEDGPPKPKKHKKDKKDKSSKRSEDTAHTGGTGSIAPAPSASAAEITDFLTKNTITLQGDITPVLSFAQLDIPSELRQALSGFTAPTPIQSCAWPALLAGKDVVGIAETGSGKTLAFGLPALVHIQAHPVEKKSKNSVAVLVVAPTRELALQTHETMVSLGAPLGVHSVCLFGGVDKEAQKRTLAAQKGLRIVVGTPGRILDLLNEQALDLSRVSYMVLDEADRMLDRGFENDIRQIISHTKDIKERQTLMFSATWPESVRRLASSFMRSPVRITVGKDELTANKRVEQVVEVFDDPRSKEQRLSKLLRSLQHKKKVDRGSDESRILIFALYKAEASRIEGNLRREGYSVGSIHGDLSQQQRLSALDDFKTGRVGLLVATDVAARGLDIPNVGVVVNVTFPLTVEDYIHRIGRTGRGGKEGKSITYFTGEKHERALAGELMRVLKDSGFDAPGLNKFPMTVKKKTHSAYGAFFREEVPASSAPKKITFD